MRVRLVRKLADRLDGVDVSGHSSGDILELSRRDAELLIAERWAAPEAAGREERYWRRAEDRIRDETDRRATRGEAISSSADPAEPGEVKDTREADRERIGTPPDDRDR